MKREGLEPQECVVKILRPNAALAAHRERDLFIAACGGDESMKATFEGRFKSIEGELDLAIEAGNMRRAGKTYAYEKDVPEIGTFKNTTSAKLFGGVKPTSGVMMQEKAEGVTVKQFLEEMHNFLESQKRLSATMDDTARLVEEIDARLGTENPAKPLSMMQCLVQVVKNNISLKLLSTIGIGNAGDVMNSIRNDPLLKPQDGNVVIVP